MFDDLNQLLDNITPVMYESLKRAVELGKWPDGRVIEKEQRQLCMQALIAWEIKHNIPEDQRIGYIAKDECSSKSAFEPINFIDK